jgi:hypothetical protein
MCVRECLYLYLYACVCMYVVTYFTTLHYTTLHCTALHTDPDAPVSELYASLRTRTGENRGLTSASALCHAWNQEIAMRKNEGM